jgi:hypothetical protein
MLCFIWGIDGNVVWQLDWGLVVMRSQIKSKPFAIGASYQKQMAE